MASGDATASIIVHLKLATDLHASMYSELYLAPRYYTIKWHHLFHLPDDLKLTGNMLSCFPMERKHNAIKVHLLHSFRSCEHTAVTSYLNSTITAIVTGQTRFIEE